MKSCLAFFLLGLAAVTLPAQDLNERYLVDFYGIEIPPDGAHVLIVADRSKSMNVKDIGRDDGGTRWMTLIREVTDMVSQMEAILKTRPVRYTVTMLYEGGGDHVGTAAYNLRVRGAGERLVTDITAERPGAGGNFEKTFCEHLWPLVARDSITHIFFLGDTDIDRQESEVIDAVSAWYALPTVIRMPQRKGAKRKVQSEPIAYGQRELYALKKRWGSLWDHYRGPKRSGRAIPPPVEEVVFNCITIGRESTAQNRLAELGGGQCVRVSAKKGRKRADGGDE